MPVIIKKYQSSKILYLHTVTACIYDFDNKTCKSLKSKYIQLLASKPALKLLYTD